ncbi:MAG: hypothetical protein R6U50_15040 [Desulfobacterales bacterium]
MEELERLELEEYRLAEKVEKRLLDRAKIVMLPLLAGFILLGFLGVSVLIDHISNRVSSHVNAGIEKDTNYLREQLRDKLLELEYKNSNFNYLKDVEKEYGDMLTRMEAIQASLTTTKSDVETATRNTENLMAAINEITSGKPELYFADLNWNGNDILEHGIVKGSNLEKASGKVEIRSVLIGAEEIATTWVALDNESIASWSNWKIELDFSDLTKSKIEDATNDLKMKVIKANIQPHLDSGIFYKATDIKVVTASGTEITHRQHYSKPPIT